MGNRRYAYRLLVGKGKGNITWKIILNWNFKKWAGKV
jgi:hypothetical protein